eukprot:9117110-Pyramimonas_sp.AAC.2
MGSAAVRSGHVSGQWASPFRHPHATGHRYESGFTGKYDPPSTQKLVPNMNGGKLPEMQQNKHTAVAHGP